MLFNTTAATLGALIVCLTLPGQKIPAPGTQAATRPTQRPVRLSIEVPAEISDRREVPLVASLTYEADTDEKLSNYSFLFILLDAEGNQVSTHPFYREAIFVEVPLVGKNPTYKPRLALDPYCKEIVPGQRYQIICVVPQFGLAASAWVTVQADKQHPRMQKTGHD